MEVVLRKSKITNSIIKQTVKASEEVLKSSDYEVLGWCNYLLGKHLYKYILLYNQKTKDLKKYLFFGKLEKEYVNDYRGRDYYSPERFDLKVITPNFVDTIYTFQKEEERASFMKDLEVIKKRAEQQGQIYL
jgi:hypothetical protein